LANLHYENLPEVWRPDVEERVASWYFYPVRRFLKRAIQACYDKKAVLAWKPIEDPSKPDKELPEDSEATTSVSNEQEKSPATTGEPEEQHQEVWIQLEDPEGVEDVENVDDSTYQMFFDAYSVTDSITRQYIRVIDKDYKTASLCLDRLPSSPTIEVWANPYTLKRQQDALNALEIRPHPYHRPLMRLIERNDIVQWPPFHPRRLSEWYILTEDSRPGNDDQRRFVNIAMNTPDFAFLEGPPGSGKTTAICELILQLINEGKRILLCASTHVAVDNVLERLMYREEVIAVRIGDRSNVSAKARPFQLEERKATEKRELVDFLAKFEERSPSQDLLLEVLQRDDSEDNIVNLILDSANLVCGTTIGILQYPRLREGRRAEPLFDVLIVDEASKTTFPEFLVPALLARRWILSGDPRQLSPYVDQEEVASNLEHLLSEQDAGICLVCFEAMKRHTPFILANPPSDLLDYYQLQAEKLDLAVHQIENGKKRTRRDSDLMLLGADLIVGDLDAIKSMEEHLPVGSTVAYGNIDLPSLDRQSAYLNAHSDGGFRERGLKPAEQWAYELSWRLDRMHQLRIFPKQIEGLEEDMELLRPAWSDEEEKEDIDEATNLVRRIALPSIIELLQEGIARGTDETEGCPLTDGMHEDVLEERRVVIPYQHRMHPDISRFPRDHFYESDALKDPPNIEKDRSWSYPRYSKRAIWIEVEGWDRQNLNEREVDVLIRELKAFRKWAKSNPRRKFAGNSDLWEVAVLTPYRRQENEFRRRLRSIFRSGAYKTFRDKRTGVTVKLCTVDRFQGQEADVVFISLVRTRRPGFMDVPNRLNVAITRSRFQLVLVGKRSFYKRQSRSPLLKSLAEELPSTVDFRGGGR
jgi:hypothetical protein